MANRAKSANALNHRRQMSFLRKGIVMIPKLTPFEKMYNKSNRG